MAKGFRFLWLCLSLWTFVGTINGVHRNTANIERSPTQTDFSKSHVTSFDQSRKRSGSLLQPNINTLSGPQFANPARTSQVENNIPVYSPPSQTSQISRSDNLGNYLPFSAIERERNVHPFPHRERRTFDYSTEPVGEPPVTFLNRERMRRRNRMLSENSHVPPDVQPSTFEQPIVPHQEGVLSYPEQGGGRVASPYMYGSRTPMPHRFPDVRPGHRQEPWFQGGSPTMMSFPSDGGIGVSPSFEPPPSYPSVERFQNYEQLMTSIDQMLDALPMHMRLMLVRRRMMRRRHRRQQLPLMHDPYFRGPIF